MSIKVTPLHPKFVARVEGVDIACDIPDADFADLRAVFEKHSVIIIHNQNIDDEKQMIFSKRFGELEMMAPHLGNNGVPRHISVMHNEDKDDTSHRMINVYLPVCKHDRHSDSSFKSIPSLCSMLHARCCLKKAEKRNLLHEGSLRPLDSK